MPAATGLKRARQPEGSTCPVRPNAWGRGQEYFWVTSSWCLETADFPSRLHTTGSARSFNHGIQTTQHPGLSAKCGSHLGFSAL